MSQPTTSMHKILFVCDAFWPYVGGAEVGALTVLSRLAQQGLKVSVLTHSFFGTKPEEFHENLRINREKLFSPRSVTPLTIDFFHRVLFYAKALRVISRYIKKIKPDIILAQQLVSIPTILASRIFHIPVVTIVHDYWPICYNRNMLKYNGQFCSSYDIRFCELYTCAKNDVSRSLHVPKFLESISATLYSILILIHTSIAKQLLKRANAIITVSYFVKKMLVLNGFDPRKIQVVYNPIRIKGFTETQHEDVPYILYLGRLDFEKGVEFLLRAMPKVCQKIGEVRLIVVGRGSQERYLRSLAESLQIERFVKFLGNVSDDFLGRLYKSSTVVVVPSIWAEPFGRVVAEAIMHRRPVVASNVGGIPELISGKSGILVPPGDVRALADAITSYIKNKVTYGFNPRISQRFSQDAVVAKVLDTMNAIMQQR